MASQGSILTVKEILSVLIGRDGVSAIQSQRLMVRRLEELDKEILKEIEFPSVVDGVMADPGINYQLRGLENERQKIETETGRTKTRFMISDLIVVALQHREIEALDDVELLKDMSSGLEVRVEMDSLFLWFKENPAKKEQMTLGLSSIDRQFPESWTVNTRKRNSPARPDTDRGQTKDFKEKQFIPTAVKLYSSDEVSNFPELMAAPEIEELLDMCGLTDEQYPSERTLKEWNTEARKQSGKPAKPGPSKKK
jgi:hypothetical protein